MTEQSEDHPVIVAIRNIRNAAELYVNKELAQLADDLERTWSNAALARDLKTFEDNMRNLNGLWAKAKNDMLKITKRPMLPAKPGYTQ